MSPGRATTQRPVESETVQTLRRRTCAAARSAVLRPERPSSASPPGALDDRLRRVYELAPARAQQYLEHETAFVLSRVSPESRVLELGCGYGRVLAELAPRAHWVVGIDTAPGSIAEARVSLASHPNCLLATMDARALDFADEQFDLVVCIQNGISAFKADPVALMREALRVTRPGGKALFSSYSERFWGARLEWFRLQAQAGLIGAIDEQETRDGIIVCKDGFRATTASPDQFRAWAGALDVHAVVEEVDDSSVFCELSRA